MRFVSYVVNNETKVGFVTNEGIVPISHSMEEVVQFGSEELTVLQNQNAGNSAVMKEDNLVYAPCVPNHRKIICVGLNYRKHAVESGMAIPKVPILFNKFDNALAGHMENVTLPELGVEYDYEAELGVVIGKRAKDVPKEDALDYVFGYCAVNDLSARDLQMLTGQWMVGKSLDGFCPVGPYLVTADEIENSNNLKVTCTLNGELRQNSNTKDMIFHVDEIISYVSRYITLEAGDFILTGTPEGVILGYPEDKKQWLKPGDEVVVEIEGLGQLRNRMIAEAL